MFTLPATKSLLHQYALIGNINNFKMTFYGTMLMLFVFIINLTICRSVVDVEFRYYVEGEQQGDGFFLSTQ